MVKGSRDIGNYKCNAVNTCRPIKCRCANRNQDQRVNHGDGRDVVILKRGIICYP